MQESYLYKDDEQNLLLQECIEILSNEGYFKARISSFDVFDKIVGGMLWCLAMTTVQMDSSYLFMENMSIGERIFVTEKIVKVLRDINCPFQIEPHQIQGYDLKNILPVLKWLLDISRDARKLKNKANEEYQQWNYFRYCQLNETELNVHPSFKHRESNSKQILDNVKIQIDRCSKQNMDVGGSILTNLVELNISESHKLQKIFNKLQTKLATLIAEYQKTIESENILNEESIQLQTKVETIKTQIQNNTTIITNIKKQYATSTERNKFKSVLEYINEHEVLQKTKKDNRNKYKTQLKELEVKLNEITNKFGIDSKERWKKEYEEKVFEHKNIKNALKDACVSLEINKNTIKELKFKQNDHPTISELNSYQQRYSELYKQMMIVQNETQNTFLLFNNLNDIVMMMRKENSLFKSIIENYKISSSSSYQQIEFKNSLEHIYRNSMNALTTLQSQYNTSLEKYQHLQKKHQDIVSLQVSYNRLLKQFHAKIDEKLNE